MADKATHVWLEVTAELVNAVQNSSDKKIDKFMKMTNGALTYIKNVLVKMQDGGSSSGSGGSNNAVGGQ